MGTFLESSWAKWRRGGEHLELYEREVEVVLDPNTNPLVVKGKLEDRALISVGTWRIRRLPEIGTRLPAIIGDAINNYRAALDHLAWTLVRLGSDPHPRRPRSIYFPMTTSEREFRKQRASRLPGIPSDQVALIKGYQPYRHTPEARTMNLLRNLSDKDKHRVLIPTLLAPHFTKIEIVTTGYRVVETVQSLKPERALKLGAVVVEAFFELRPSSRQQRRVNMEGTLGAYPSFGRRVPVGNALHRISETVWEILVSLESTL